MKNIIRSLFRKLISTTLVAGVAFSLFTIAFVAAQGIDGGSDNDRIFFKKQEPNNIIMQDPLFEIGSSTDRVVKGWFDDLDTNTITIQAGLGTALNDCAVVFALGGLFSGDENEFCFDSVNERLSVGIGTGTATINADDIDDDQLSLARNAGVNEWRFRVGGSGDLIYKSVSTEVGRWLQGGELGLRTAAPIATLGLAPGTTGTSEPVLNFKQSTSSDRGYMVNVDNSGTGNWEITRRFDGAETAFQVWSGSKLGIGGIPDAGFHVIENTTSAGNTTPSFHLEQLDSGDVSMVYSVAANDWVSGIDNGSGDRYRIQHSDQLLGTDVGFTMKSTGLNGFNVNDPLSTFVVQENTTVTDITAGINIENTGTGDTSLHWSGGGTSFTAAIDNSSNNQWRLQNGDAVGVGGAGLTLTTGNEFAVGTVFPASLAHFYEDTVETDEDAGVTIEQDGAGDALLQFLLTGAQRWVLGGDNNGGDSFKISSSTGLDVDVAMEIDTVNRVSVGGVTPSQGRFEIHDNGHTGNTAALIRLDDDSPWALRIENATYGTGTANSFRYFLEDATGDLRQYAPNKAGFLGDFEFWLDDTHTNTMLANGRAGFGGGLAVNPAERFHISGVNDAANIGLAIQNESTTANSKTSIHFRTTTGATDFGLIQLNRADSSNATLDFQTRSGGATTSAMIIDVDQNLNLTGGGINIDSGLGLLADGLSFGSAGTGFAEISSGRLGFFTNNVETFRMRDAFGGIFHGNVVNSGAMLNEAATLTNPSFAPNRTDPDSGIGANGLDSVVFITDSIAAVEIDSTQHATFSNAINYKSKTITSVDSPYTTDGETIIYVDTTTASVTVDLATADTVDGRCMKIIDIGNAATNNVDLTTEGSELFQGQATANITADFGRLEPCSNGTDWF